MTRKDIGNRPFAPTVASTRETGAIDGLLRRIHEREAADGSLDRAVRLTPGRKARPQRSRVASKLVPAAQKMPTASEYIARSTTICAGG